MSSLSKKTLHEKLNIDHLNEILVDLWKAMGKWYFIGLHLKLETAALESIKTSEVSTEERFTAVLRKLLEGNGCNPITWSHLVDALDSITVGHSRLADTLRKKYSTTLTVRESDDGESSIQSSSNDQDAASSSSGYNSSDNGHMVGPQVLQAKTPHDHLPDRFKKQIRKVKVGYLALLEHGQKSFNERKVPVQKVAEVVRIYHKPELSYRTLSGMSCMNEVWATLKENTSWYNSDLVEAIVKIHGAESDQRNLKEFKNELMKLKPYLNGNSDQRKKITMILKLEEDFNQFLGERLQQVCLTLCDLLDTLTCPTDVQEGCVKITVSIPAEVAEDILPFSPALKKTFQKAFPTLISIICGRVLEAFKTTEDTDISVPSNEQCCPDEVYNIGSPTPSEGLSEDGYFADRSESDEEKCKRKVETCEDTHEGVTSAALHLGEGAAKDTGKWLVSEGATSTASQLTIMSVGEQMGGLAAPTTKEIMEEMISHFPLLDPQLAKLAGGVTAKETAKQGAGSVASGASAASQLLKEAAKDTGERVVSTGATPAVLRLTMGTTMSVEEQIAFRSALAAPTSKEIMLSRFPLLDLQLTKFAGGVAAQETAKQGAGYSSYKKMENGEILQKEFRRHVVKRSAAAGGFLACGAIGAAIGTAVIPVPFVGTFVGSVVGGVIGDFVGSKCGEEFYKLAFDQSEDSTQDQNDDEDSIHDQNKQD